MSVQDDVIDNLQAVIDKESVVDASKEWASSAMETAKSILKTIKDMDENDKEPSMAQLQALHNINNVAKACINYIKKDK